MTVTLIKTVSRKGFILVITLSALSIFIESKGLPISIFLGGLTGLVNFRGLARSVQNFTASDVVGNPLRRITASTIFRLSVLTIALALLYRHDLINIPGFIIGLTLVVYLILFEGYFLLNKAE